MSTVRMIATLYAAPEVKDQVRSDMANLVALSQTEEGCLQYDYYEIDQEGMPGVDNTGGDFVVIEEWQDAATLQAHSESEHSKAFHSSYAEGQIRISLQILNEAK